MPRPMLLEPAWVATAERDTPLLRDASILVEDGRIAAIAPRDVARTRFAGVERMALATHLLVPGFVNLHTHAAMSLLRGTGDDLPLQRWLQERIWPAEGRLVNAQFVYDGAVLACHEMLMGGVTTFNDMYFFPESVAEAARALRMRAQVGIIVIDFPSAYATGPDDYLRKGLELRDRASDQPLLGFCLAPHAPYTVGDEALRRVATLARELDLPIHMHVHETAHEVAQSVASTGARPLQRLDRLGLLGPELIAVHAVHLDDTDLALMQARHVSVAHCPHSNLKLASGIAPVARLLDAGINVGIGTDGSASNNRLDLIGEARSAALLAKGASGRADVWPAEGVLEAMTIAGARALGLDARIGSIRVGKQADLVAVDLGAPELQPVFDPVSQFVYAAGREHVTDVWVDGVHVVHKRQLVDSASRGAVSEVVSRIRVWQNRLEGILSTPAES